MKSMKKLVLLGLVLLASVMVLLPLVGCKSEVEAVKVYRFPAAVKVLTDYESPNNTDDTWTYVAFGEWPQSEVDVSKVVLEKVEGGRGYFADNYYTDGQGNDYVMHSDSYYKVEPIVWRVLNKDCASTGKALLLAEKILIGIPWHYGKNNYMESNIRQWLNGNSGNEAKSDCKGAPGFLQTAFTDKDLWFIAETTVDNTARSTNPDSNESKWNSGKNPYACGNTSDKIFLLSEQEATTEGCGFAAYNAGGGGNTRIRVTTDYAKAIGAYQNETTGYGGCWWLRSPYYNDEDIARNVDDVGYANNFDNSVDDTEVGVVPALYIKLQ